MSNRKQTILGLERLGFVLQHTGKYLRFEHPSGNYATHLVGKSGALRLTTTTVAKSQSFSDRTYHQHLRVVGIPSYKFSDTKTAWVVLGNVRYPDRDDTSDDAAVSRAEHYMSDVTATL
tara:strand:- start:2463 stop:2819 length:357 start_codon:yes stop_codon:yes gene_type:complete